MGYDLKSVDAPRLKGLLLSAIVRLVENPLTRPLILPKLLEGAGVAAFRKCRLDETPASWPPIEPQNPDAREEWPETQTRAPPGSVFETVEDFANAYRHKTHTPEEVAEHVLKAIDDSNGPELNLRAVVAHHPDDVRAQARASSERHARGCALGPLDGVPLVVKEEVDVLGYATTAGTTFLKTIATTDATVVHRMRAAGVMLIGKANMHEIGIDTTGFNAHHGTPCNPYDPGCYTGGSSSGSAAAVAAGLCPLAIGADGGGSIRIPASLCGIVGLKPTFGRMSVKGAYPLCWSVAHVGPIGATVDDVAIGYRLMGGMDGDSRNGQVGQERGLDGLRIGVYEPWFSDATADVVRVCRQLLTEFEAAGATIVPIELPDLELCRVAHGITILSEMATSMAPFMKDHRRDFGLPVRLTLSLAQAFTARDYIRAQQVRARFASHAERALSLVDIIVTPTTACTAPRIRSGVLPAGESDLVMTSALMRHTFPWNLTGHPAISFPAGYDDTGLPIGMQAVGRAWSEALLLRIARVAGDVVPRRPPKVHFSLLHPEFRERCKTN